VGPWRRIWSGVIGALVALATLALFYHFTQTP
jgi:hypothetical protein